MKYLIVFLIFTSIGYSQTNFKVIDKQVVWQRVFKDSTVNLADHLNKTGFTNNLTFKNNSFTGYSNKHKLLAKWLPGYAQDDLTAFIKIEVKPDRYRVSVSNITFKALEVEIWGVKDKSDYHLKRFILKSDGTTIRQNRGNLKALKALNLFFLKTFTLKKDAIDKW